MTSSVAATRYDFCILFLKIAQRFNAGLLPWEKARNAYASMNSTKEQELRPSDRERVQLLLELRGNVRHDEGELVLILQLEHVANPMNLRDQPCLH